MGAAMTGNLDLSQLRPRRVDTDGTALQVPSPLHSGDALSETYRATRASVRRSIPLGLPTTSELRWWRKARASGET